MPVTAQRTDAPVSASDLASAEPLLPAAPSNGAVVLRSVADIPEMPAIENQGLDAADVAGFRLSIAGETDGFVVVSLDPLRHHPILFSETAGYCAVVLVPGVMIYDQATSLWFGNDFRLDADSVCADAVSLLQDYLGPAAHVFGAVWLVDAAGGGGSDTAFSHDAARDIIHSAITRGLPTPHCHGDVAPTDPKIASRCLANIGQDERAAGPYHADLLDEMDAVDMAKADNLEAPDDILVEPFTSSDWDNLRARYSFLDTIELTDIGDLAASRAACALSQLDPAASRGGLCRSTRIPSAEHSAALAVALAAGFRRDPIGRFWGPESSLWPDVDAAADALSKLDPEILSVMLGSTSLSHPWGSPIGNWLFLAASRGDASAMKALARELAQGARNRRAGLNAATLAENWSSLSNDPNIDVEGRIASVAGSSITLSLADLAARAEHRAAMLAADPAPPAESATPVRREIAGPSRRVLRDIGDPESSEGKSAKRRFGDLLQPLALRGAADPDSIWNTLQAEFPWMKEANRAVAEAAGIARHSKRDYFRFRPLLILGPSGCGKSRWARRVAEVCDLAFSTTALAGAISSVLISGIERGWSSARPGHAVVAMQNTGSANPLILVDEADKAGTDRNNGHPLDALLPLLEPETARRHFDPYLLSYVDLSAISWILTANTIGTLSPEIMSRVRTVAVSRPSVGDIDLILPTVVHDVCADLELDAADLPDITHDLHVARRAFEADLDIRKFKLAVEQRITERIWTPNGLRLVEA